jgi:ligand-binding sensor domain-containing protein
MKHLLNELSDSEKNRILEQYDNSLIIETNKFNKFINSKLGNVKPLLEQEEDSMEDDEEDEEDYYLDIDSDEEGDEMEDEEEDEDY